MCNQCVYKNHGCNVDNSNGMQRPVALHLKMACNAMQRSFCMALVWKDRDYLNLGQMACKEGLASKFGGR
jgi:hypothetical protein